MPSPREYSDSPTHEARNHTHIGVMDESSLTSHLSHKYPDEPESARDRHHDDVEHERKEAVALPWCAEITTAGICPVVSKDFTHPASPPWHGGGT